MQEEVNDRTIALAVRTSRMTASVLKASLMVLIRSKYYKHRYSQPQKTQDEVRTRGKQSLSNLMKDGSQISTVEITDDNIKSFERVARKYSIDFSLKKDNSLDPPRYIVFFKAKDVDVMDAAFREYTGITMKRDREELKLPIADRLERAAEKVIDHRQRIRSRNRMRGQER